MTPSSSFGGPYTYFVDNVQQNSPVVFNLCGGGHTAQVIDGDGNLSDVVSFDIVSTTPSIISYESCTYSSGSVVNLNSGGNKKWNFQTIISNKPAACNLVGRVRITYQYTDFGYSTPAVSIQPTLPLGTWTLISNTTSTETTSECGTYDVTTRVYESSNYNINSSPYTLLISNCGFNWSFNNPSGLNSSCTNGNIKVRGAVTVKMISLTASGNICCVITPADYTIGNTATVNVLYNKILPPTVNQTNTGTQCNPGAPSPGGEDIQ
jgi:hypothetical protein